MMAVEEPDAGPDAEAVGREGEERAPGLPVATVALYGPDDATATKIAAGIIPTEDAKTSDLRRWVSDGVDIRHDAQAAAEVLTFIAAAGAMSVTMIDRILGCPHEEGIDDEGPTCPACLF